MAFVSVVKSMIWKSSSALEANFDYKIKQLNITKILIEFLIKKTIYVEYRHRFEEPKVPVIVVSVICLKNFTVSNNLKGSST